MIDASTLKRMHRQYGGSVAVHMHQAKRDVMALVAEVERLQAELVVANTPCDGCAQREVWLNERVGDRVLCTTCRQLGAAGLAL